MPHLVEMTNRDSGGAWINDNREVKCPLLLFKLYRAARGNAVNLAADFQPDGHI